MALAAVTIQAAVLCVLGGRARSRSRPWRPRPRRGRRPRTRAARARSRSRRGPRPSPSRARTRTRSRPRRPSWPQSAGHTRRPGHDHDHGGGPGGGRAGRSQRATPGGQGTITITAAGQLDRIAAAVTAAGTRRAAGGSWPPRLDSNICTDAIAVTGPARWQASACCLGFISGAPGTAAPTASPPTPPVAVVARPDDHNDQPHTPEVSEPEPLASPEAEIIEEHVLVADHPIYGQLNGHNYLGYCDTCPLATQRALCPGPVQVRSGTTRTPLRNRPLGPNLGLTGECLRIIRPIERERGSDLCPTHGLDQLPARRPPRRRPGGSVLGGQLAAGTVLGGLVLVEGRPAEPCPAGVCPAGPCPAAIVPWRGPCPEPGQARTPAASDAGRTAPGPSPRPTPGAEREPPLAGPRSSWQRGNCRVGKCRVGKCRVPDSFTYGALTCGFRLMTRAITGGGNCWPDSFAPGEQCESCRASWLAPGGVHGGAGRAALARTLSYHGARVDFLIFAQQDVKILARPGTCHVSSPDLPPRGVSPAVSSQLASWSILRLSFYHG